MSNPLEGGFSARLDTLFSIKKIKIVNGITILPFFQSTISVTFGILLINRSFISVRYKLNTRYAKVIWYSPQIVPLVLGQSCQSYIIDNGMSFIRLLNLSSDFWALHILLVAFLNLFSKKTTIE